MHLCLVLESELDMYMLKVVSNEKRLDLKSDISAICWFASTIHSSQMVYIFSAAQIRSCLQRIVNCRKASDFSKVTEGFSRESEGFFYKAGGLSEIFLELA